MAAITVRDLDDGVRDRLRLRAAEHGRSMEAEIRVILSDAVAVTDRSAGLLATLRDRFEDIGGVDLELPRRSVVARSVEFDE